MKYKLSILISTFLISAISLSGQLYAQETSVDSDNRVEEVFVTGSLIRKKTGYESSSPVTVVDRELIGKQGVADLVDLAGTLTVNAGSIVSQETGALIGTSQFNIRNLGSGSTLTLINGRRGGLSAVADSNGNLFFDNKQLPLAMIERIDVQTDGASTTYGSDAVAGVVNIITRKGFEGFELSARYQDSSNESFSLNLATGFKTDRGMFNLYATYYNQSRNHRTDFDWLVERIHGDGDLTKSKLISSTGSPGTYRPVNATLAGGSVISASAFGPRYPDVDCEAAGGVMVGGICRYNFADQVAIVPEENRLQIFTEIEYDFSDTSKFFSEFSFSNNNIVRTQGPNGFSNGLVSNGNTYIPADHPFNFWTEDISDPTGNSLVYVDPSDPRWAAGTLQAVDLACQCRPQGVEANGSGDSAPFNRIIDLDYIRSMIGFERRLSDSWLLSTNYMFAQATRNFRALNNWNSVTLNQSVLDGTFNPFGSSRVTPDLVSPKDGVSVAGNSPETLLFIMNQSRSRQESTQQVFEVVASGEVSDSVDLAIGAQYRKDERDTTPDALASRGLGNSSSLGAGPSSAEQNISAVFTEAYLPLSEKMELTLALRHEDYGQDGGSTTDPKLAFRWDISDMLALRTSWGTAFQGPSIPQTGLSSSSAFIDDSAVLNTTTGQLECGDGGGSNIVDIDTQGSDNLKPQSSENFNLGLILNLTGDLRLSVDYWNFDYKDLITKDDAQTVVDDDCKDDGVLNDPKIVRDAAGQLREIDLFFVNSDSVKTDGIDIAADYNFGAFNTGLNLTYVNKFEVTDDGKTFDGVGNRNFTNRFGSLPEIRATAKLGFAEGQHAANLIVRYIDSYLNDQNLDDQENPFKIDSYVAVDLNYAYDLQMNLDYPIRLKVGVRNLFDEDPPSLGQDQRPGYDDLVHDVRGQAVFFEIAKNF